MNPLHKRNLARYRTSLFVLMFLLVAPFANSESTQSLLESSQIQVQGQCFERFGNYDAWIDFLKEKNGWLKGVMLSFVFDEDKYNQFKASLDCFGIAYLSDGIQVMGYLVVPKNRKKDEKLRTIIFNRGGNQSYGAISFAHLFSFIFPLAHENNAVFASQYRGLLKKNRHIAKDEFGGKDVDDVINLAEQALKLPFVDPKRLFMVGQSRGAMMTYMAARQNQLPIKAIATMGSLVDLQAEIEFRPEMENVYKGLIPDYANNKQAAIAERSAVQWVEDIPNIPILLQHGEDDTQVNLAQIENFANLLNKANRKNSLVVYPDANHGLRGAGCA